MSEPFAEMLDYQRKMVEAATGMPKIFLGLDPAHGCRNATGIAAHEAATGKVVSTMLVKMQRRLNSITNALLDMYTFQAGFQGRTKRRSSRKEIRRRRYYRHYAFIGRCCGRV